MTERDLLKRVEAHYPAPEFAVLTHVRNGTGASKVTRTADAIALSLYPSRGIVLHGFEVKVSRSDWKRELQEPDKQEEIGAYCHHWWMVTPDESIIKEGELPTGWGWLVADPKSDKLKVVTRSPRREEPKPLSLLFVASLLRNVCEDKKMHWVRQSDIADRVKEAFERGKISGDYSMGRELQDVKSELQTLKNQITAFETASGVSLKTGRFLDRDVVAIGEVVADVLAGRVAQGQLKTGLKQAERQLQYAQSALEATMKAVRAATTPPPSSGAGAMMESEGGNG